MPFKYAYKKEHLLRADGSHPYPASARRNKKFPDISYFPKIFKMSYGRQCIQNMFVVLCNYQPPLDLDLTEFEHMILEVVQLFT